MPSPNSAVDVIGWRRRVNGNRRTRLSLAWRKPEEVACQQRHQFMLRRARRRKVLGRERHRPGGSADAAEEAAARDEAVIGRFRPGNASSGLPLRNSTPRYPSG